MSSEEITTDIEDFCLFTTNKENLCLCEICLKIIFRRYPMFDKELPKYFVDTMENVISENNVESTLPYRGTIHLLRKIFFPKETHQHRVEINTKDIKDTSSVVKRNKNERCLKCDDCDFSFNYVIDRQKFLNSKKKLWIPPLE